MRAGAGRVAAVASAVGAAALVVGAVALASTPAAGAWDGSAAGAVMAVDVPVPAAGSALACPGAPVAVTGPDSSRSRTAGAVAAATTGLVQDGAGAALTATPLVVRAGDDASGAGSTADSASTSTSAAPAAVQADRLGDLLRVAAKPAGVTAGTATALAAAPVGGGAPLLAGATTAVATTGDLRGLVASACVAPAEETWLVGGSTGVGRSTRLVLADTGDTPTSVDVTVLTADGPQQPSALQGLSLGAGEQRSVLLEGVLDGVLDDAGTRDSADDGDSTDDSDSTGDSTDSTGGAPLAVQVRSSAGGVAAWLVESALDGLVPAGQEVVAPAATPATSLLVPGVVTSGTGGAVLRVGNPGTEPVVARFSVVGAAGSTVASGATPATAVPAGGVVDVVLPSLPGGGVAVAVDADGPVVAGVRTDSPPASTNGKPAAGDLAWTAATEPLGAPTLVAMPPATGRSASGAAPDTRLVLTSGDRAAAVDVALVGADGVVGTARRVELPATTTTAADVDDLVAAAGASGAPVALLLTPVDGTGGDVVAAVATRVTAAGGGDLVAAAPVSPGAQARTSVSIALEQS